MVSRAALLLSAAFAAAADNSTCSKHLNATSQSDLDGISSCQKFDASIYISGDAATLALNGVKEVTGDLSVVSASDLTSFSAPQLQTIGGAFKLNGLTVLNTLALPDVTSIGQIQFQTLPALEEFQFNTGVQDSRNILISDTSLKSLDGLNLSEVDTFNVNNNKYINDITIKATSISQLLDISYNSDDVNVSLPNLEWANNATFRYCASVSMPNITKVNQSIGFINNTMYGLQFDKLEQVGGSLAINSNSELRNASFSSLKSIGGGFVIANNSHYGKVGGFPKLSKVGGAIEFTGNFTLASLPSLSEVDGGVQVNSSNVFNCSTFDEAHKKGDFHGDKYVCKGKSTTVSTKLSSVSKTSSGSGSASNRGAAGGADATSAGSSKSGSASKSGSSSGSSSSKKSKNVAPAVAVGSTGVFGGVLAVLFQLV